MIHDEICRIHFAAFWQYGIADVYMLVERVDVIRNLTKMAALRLNEKSQIWHNKSNYSLSFFVIKFER